ncbi:MAG: type IX secretion system membrane protein PorP/SprF [Prolixibacteraceae bacterium]
MKFKLNISKALGILILVIAANVSFAQQDPMYTQYMFNTQTINPAYAGTWESVGFLVLARQQWSGFDGAPQTYTFSFQAPLKNERVALGLNVINDKTGLEKRFSVFGDYSYQIPIDFNTNLRFGLKAGFTNYSNNLAQYRLYPGEDMDPLFQGEINNKFMPNFGMGAFLYSKKYYVGFSVPKLVHNDFEDNLGNFSVQAEMRHYFLIAGTVHNLNEDLKFKPTMLTKATFGPESGSPVEVDLSANFLFKEKFWLGAMYRTGDSFGFLAQWIFDRKLRVGYSIDFSTTNLQNYNNGTHEIMVSYELKFLKEKFVSPRYF